MAAGDMWVVGAVPDQVYQRINNVWQTGIDGPAGQTSLQGIAFDAAGDMWVCGTAPDQIYQRLNGVWQTGIAGPAGQTGLTGIAFDANGDMWVCGQTLEDQVYQRINNVWQTGIDGPAGQTSLQGIAFDAAGDMWVCGTAPDQIYQRLNGVWQTGIAGPAGQLVLTGIAFDANGDMWVCGTVPDQVYQRINNVWRTGIAGPIGQESLIDIAFEPIPPTPTSTAMYDEYNLGDKLTSGYDFSVSILLDPRLIEGGATAYLRFFDNSGSSARLRLSSGPTGDPNDLGPSFADYLIVADEAIILYSDVLDDEFILKGPNHPANGFSDPTEPYFWTPDNGVEFAAWWISFTGDVSIRFLLPEEATGGHAEVVSWLFDIPGAIGQTLSPPEDSNAEVVSWLFDVPGARGQAVSPPADSNAEVVSWLFTIPGAIGQTLSPPEDSNAEVVSWLFDVPGARGQAISPPESGEGIAEVVSWLFNVPGAIGQTLSPPEDSNAEVVSWLFDVPGAIGQAAIPFTLSQFVIPSGQQIVFAGLIEIGVSGEDRYRPGTNVGSLLDGDLNLAPDLTINRLRVRSGPRLTFNRSGSGTFAGYLEGTGDYADGTIHIQNSEGVTSQLISSIPAADILNGVVHLRTAAITERIDSLSAGDRAIIALTEPIPI